MTKEGEDLYRIATKLEKSIASSEKDLLKIMNKEFTFIIGSSFTIGNYIIPNYLNEIKNRIGNEVHIKVGLSKEIIDKLEDAKIDIALIESPEFRDGIVYREWVEDELVVFSNQPIKKNLGREDLLEFDWLCRDEGSHTRRLTSEAFEEIGIQCCDFNVIGVLTSSTSIKETIVHSDKNAQRPLVSVMSRHVVSNEVKNGTLFEARIKNYKMERNFYIAYSKDRKHDAFVDNVVNYLLSLTNKI